MRMVNWMLHYLGGVFRFRDLSTIQSNPIKEAYNSESWHYITADWLFNNVNKFGLTQPRRY